MNNERLRVLRRSRGAEAAEKLRRAITALENEPETRRTGSRAGGGGRTIVVPGGLGRLAERVSYDATPAGLARDRVRQGGLGLPTTCRAIGCRRHQDPAGVDGGAWDRACRSRRARAPPQGTLIGVAQRVLDRFAVVAHAPDRGGYRAGLTAADDRAGRVSAHHPPVRVGHNGTARASVAAAVCRNRCERINRGVRVCECGL